MTALPAHPDAGRLDHVHGDEGLREFTPAEQVIIERRVAELIAERLADKARFDDLLSGIEPTTEINPHLQRIVSNVIRHQDRFAVGAILAAADLITRRIEQEAREAWGEDATKVAEQELLDKRTV